MKQIWNWTERRTVKSHRHYVVTRSSSPFLEITENVLNNYPCYTPAFL